MKPSLPSGRLRSDAADKVTHGRLLNWGRYVRARAIFIGYPRKVPFMEFPSRSEWADEIDGAAIEYVVSTLTMAPIGISDVLASLLRIEYVERPEGRMKPVSERAKGLRKAHDIRCSERTYNYLLLRARAMVHALAAPI